METLQHLVNLAQTMPPELFIAVAGGIVATVMQPLKRKLSLESDKVILAVTTVVSFIPVLLQSFNDYIAMNPETLGKYTFTILGVSQLLYRFGTKPLSNFVAEAKERKQVESKVTPGSGNANYIEQIATPSSEFNG